MSMRIIYMFVLHRSNKALSEFSSSTTTLRCPCSFGDLAVLKYALRIQPAQFAWNKDITPLSYRTLTSPLHPSSSVSLRGGSRTATRAHVHSSRALCTELLQCCITLVLHDSSLLEVCDLYRNQHSSLIVLRVSSLLVSMYSPNYSRMRSQIL